MLSGIGKKDKRLFNNLQKHILACSSKILFHQMPHPKIKKQISDEERHLITEQFAEDLEKNKEEFEDENQEELDPDDDDRYCYKNY